MYALNESPLGRAAILAVDDLPSDLLAIEAIVEGLGHDFVGVRSGLEALTVASMREFAAIILDIRMPGVDGMETLRRLREISAAQGTPVIFLTAQRFDLAMVRRAYDLGAVDYLEKPVPVELLRGKLSAFISLYLQRQEIARKDEALRLKDRHMGILEHDLRSPLATALSGARQLQQHKDLGVRIVADRIARSALELKQLTNDLLASARTATSVQLKPQSVELSSLVEELVDDFRATYAMIRFSTAFVCDVLGQWDPSRIRQALSNLIANAVKHGDGWVSVETRSRPRIASVVVENGGRALSPQQIAQLGGGSWVGPRPGAGMGLGLMVAKEIAVAHGGALSAESDRKRTRFTLSLPQA